MTKLPPLTCPHCNSCRATKNYAGTIECEECGKITTKKGEVKKERVRAAMSVKPTAGKRLKEAVELGYNGDCSTRDGRR